MPKCDARHNGRWNQVTVMQEKYPFRRNPVSRASESNLETIACQYGCAALAQDSAC